MRPTHRARSHQQFPSSLCCVLNLGGPCSCWTYQQACSPSLTRMVRIVAKLRQACRNYLMEIAREGEYVGIVVFNGTYGPSTEAIGTAYVLSDLVLITDDSRQHLLDAIPKEANGATSIGKGIQLGIDVLSSIDGQSISADGGNLVVVSDGEENAPPLISDIKLNVTDFGITIDSIAIGKDGSLKLEELAEATSGSMFYYPTDAPSNALNDAFMEIGKREASKRDFPAQLFSSGDLVDSNESVLKSIFIDSTVGENTQFTVTFDGNAQVATPVTLTDPQGHVYNSNSAAYEVDVDFSSIYIRVKGTATPGEYTLRVRNNQEDSVNVTVTVTSSSAVAGTRPITADSSWLYEELYPTQQQILFTTLSKGYSPILYADVFAFVDLPGNTSEAYTLTLTDDGTGADASKDDGVYSSYFTGFTANGRYSAKVSSTIHQVTSQTYASPT
ncbi:PREDICTED: calcium-activated chloride channel regulator 4-like [Priapulus caudatus]|uniref:Calcium-activated chloride channel regulator 4-like n=1 Tax=Priapulus caudatus TaxID=37621 RepID=A0ABM1DSW1_PRICU|nr:PREDICTED: calcium-activated chloride channel regulator 4-like [Priapulus caudatus]